MGICGISSPASRSSANAISFPTFMKYSTGTARQGSSFIPVTASPTAWKAKRPIAAILKYLTLLNDQILDAFLAGTVPPVEKMTLRTAKEMEPFLKEPLSEGWKSIDELPRIGVFEKL